MTCHLRGLQRFGQLFIMQFSFLFSFSPDPVLLFLVKIVQNTADQKCDQHYSHNDKYILSYGLSFLLDSFDRHISGQIDQTVVYRPHIIQRPFSPYVMVKHNAFPVLHTLFHLGAKGLFVDVICPIKIQQIQMTRTAFPHSFWFQYKTLRFCVHNIEHGTVTVKPVRKGSVQRIISILYIERTDLLTVFHHRAFNGISPCTHIIQIRKGDCKPVYCISRRKFQSFFGKDFSRAGNPLRFPHGDQRDPYHGPVFLIGTDIFFRIFPHGDFLSHQFLKFRFFI